MRGALPTVLVALASSVHIAHALVIVTSRVQQQLGRQLPRNRFRLCITGDDELNSEWRMQVAEPP